VSIEPDGADADLFAEVRREFAAGLGERVEKMRAALEALAGRGDREEAETFHLAAHALKGTAAAFGAGELAAHAGVLTEIGLRWCGGLPVEPKDVQAARTELERLQAAIVRYRAEQEGKAG
jgi:HPt (histidine-containing phosphotransfer) domain-containing protein